MSATITAQPQSVEVDLGTPAIFSVGATGVGTLSYQWYQDGSPVGTDSPNYNTGVTVIGEDGDVVYVDVTDDNGTTTSNNAILSIFQATDYPVGYPCPTWDYSRTSIAHNRRAPFDCGWTRQRRQFSNFVTGIQLTFIMSTDVFDDWKAWADEFGYKWFNMEMDDYGSGKVTETIRLASEMSFSYDAFDRVYVNVSAESRDG
jgi:hypothetical protein